MCDKNLLPKPSPFDAPFTKPAISTKVIFVLIFDIMPFISYISELLKGDFKNEDLSKGSGLYSKGSKISFFEWCDFNPNPSENDCMPPTKLKGETVITLWNPLLWQEFGIPNQKTPIIPNPPPRETGEI